MEVGFDHLSDIFCIGVLTEKKNEHEVKMKTLFIFEVVSLNLIRSNLRIQMFVIKKVNHSGLHDEC